MHDTGVEGLQICKKAVCAFSALEVNAIIEDRGRCSDGCLELGWRWTTLEGKEDYRKEHKQAGRMMVGDGVSKISCISHQFAGLPRHCWKRTPSSLETDLHTLLFITVTAVKARPVASKYSHKMNLKKAN